MTIQYEFDFSIPEDEISATDGTSSEGKAKPFSRRLLRRAALAWLVHEEADALAPHVPTRISRFRADAAAIWCEVVRNSAAVGPKSVLSPKKSVVIECRVGREDCWPDCSNSSELSPQLKSLHLRMDAIRESIRANEPHLRRGDALFDEYAEWCYDDTTNMEFHKLRRQIHKLEKVLYKGTRFEGIKKSRIADFAYLCVPEGAIEPHELAEGWGLLWVDERLRITIVIPAEDLHCLVENRLHLAQNIALACRDSVLFNQGIRDKETTCQFVALPFLRRKPEPFVKER